MPSQPNITVPTFFRGNYVRPSTNEKQPTRPHERRVDLPGLLLVPVKWGWEDKGCPLGTMT